MRTVQSWEVSEAFWAQVEPLIPRPRRNPRQRYRRKAGGGRQPIPARRVFEGIVYVLRTGCQWKALPTARFGSPSALPRYFQEWERAGVFEALWTQGLAEYDDLEGIAWRWRSLDSSTTKAPLARDAVGPNPTDRGKKWDQAASVGRRAWRPAVPHRDRS